MLLALHALLALLAGGSQSLLARTCNDRSSHVLATTAPDALEAFNLHLGPMPRTLQRIQLRELHAVTCAHKALSFEMPGMWRLVHV